MSKELTNPLQALVKKAAQSLPATTGKTAIQQQRIDRRNGPLVVLADISASMESAAFSGQRKIDLLRDAVNAVRSRSDFRLFAFSRTAREVDAIPEPEQNTNLARGLEAAMATGAATILLISDGEPDSEHDALSLAKKFSGAIDVLYIGLEGNSHAIDFMRRLAAATDGRCTINDISTSSGVRLLQQSITALLPSPKK